MDIPKVKPDSGGFRLGNILGLIFVLMGILLILNLINFNLPVISLDSVNIILQYGAAVGSILGGLSMIFKKKETASSAMDLK